MTHASGPTNFQKLFEAKARLHASAGVAKAKIRAQSLGERLSIISSRAATRLGSKTRASGKNGSVVSAAAIVSDLRRNSSESESSSEKSARLCSISWCTLGVNELFLSARVVALLKLESNEARG